MTTLSFARHNNTFLKKPKFVSHCEKQRLLLVIASRLTAKQSTKKHLKMIFEFPYSTESVLKSLKTRKVIIRHKS